MVPFVLWKNNVQLFQQAYPELDLCPIQAQLCLQGRKNDNLSASGEQGWPLCAEKKTFTNNSVSYWVI